MRQWETISFSHKGARNRSRRNSTLASFLVFFPFLLRFTWSWDSIFIALWRKFSQICFIRNWLTNREIMLQKVRRLGFEVQRGARISSQGIKKLPLPSLRSDSSLDLQSSLLQFRNTVHLHGRDKSGNCLYGISVQGRLEQACEGMMAALRHIHERI